MMMANEFADGDTVQLRSGGPDMTVTDVSLRDGMMGDGKVHAYVTWFDKTHKVHYDSFPISTLIVISKGS